MQNFTQNFTHSKTLPLTHSDKWVHFKKFSTVDSSCKYADFESSGICYRLEEYDDFPCFSNVNPDEYCFTYCTETKKVFDGVKIFSTYGVWIFASKEDAAIAEAADTIRNLSINKNAPINLSAIETVVKRNSIYTVEKVL